MGCHDFLFENAGATYQRAMNLIFHDLIGIILEVYIDDIVIKSAGCWRLPTEYRCSILPGSIPGCHLYFHREGGE